MKKNLPLLVLAVVVTAVLLGYLGYSSITKENTPPTGRDAKETPPQIAGDDLSSGKQSKVPTSEQETSSIVTNGSKVPDVDPNDGEIIVWGEVKAVDVEKRVLTIDQQMDDNSVKISPNVPINQDAIIRDKNEDLSLAQIKQGDTVGIIVLKTGLARAVLVNY